MTSERREEVVLIALVVSIAIHVGLMFLVKPQVMTRITPASKRSARTEPMRVTKSEMRPEPVKIDTVRDLQAKKDAPAAREAAGAPSSAVPLAEEVRVDVPDAPMPSPKAPTVEMKTVFDVRPVGLKSAGSTMIPLTRIETPTASAVSKLPEFSVKVPQTVVPQMAAAPSAGSDPSSVFLPTKLTRKTASAPKADYKPAEEILEKVDERVVAAEKAAVKDMVEAEDAADLVKFVNLTMTATTVGGWQYFKVMMTPRTSLKVVPKDVVMIIDGSGSIGNDRLSGCRKAARRILRTATNTGDRFNLVVFRNAFSYAFPNWRECDAESFAAGDKWLNRQTAHGRTDVFSTISSVLTLPRDPKRPLVALVVTDGDANSGVSDTAEILSKFTALNDGLVSVYMYGVKSSANRELIDVLTHGNRGESFVFEGWRWNAGEGMEELSERFRDPVLSDLRVIFASGVQAEAYPRLLRNIYRGGMLEFVGRVPSGTKAVSFSLRGLNGDNAYEGFFKLPFATSASDPALAALWRREADIARKIGVR